MWVMARPPALAPCQLRCPRNAATVAKPMKGLGPGVFAIALPYRGNAFRVVYAVQLFYRFMIPFMLAAVVLQIALHLWRVVVNR